MGTRSAIGFGTLSAVAIILLGLTGCGDAGQGSHLQGKDVGSDALLSDVGILVDADAAAPDPGAEGIPPADGLDVPADPGAGEPAPEVVADLPGESDGACVPACAGRECGDDGCDGDCGTCGSGLACVEGQCAEVPCTGEGLHASGSLTTSVASLTFDHVAATVEHKRDVDPWEDGCLVTVVLRFQRGTGCTLTVEAGGRHDLAGRLEIRRVAFDADSQCPGFSDAQEGLYEIDGLEGSGLALSVGEVPDVDAAESCFSATFGVQVNATLFDAASGQSLAVSTATLQASGDVVSLGSYELSCPCRPACAGHDCGDAGCGFACGECGCGESCDDGTCAFHNCDGKACGDNGCGGSCGACADALWCTDDACVDGQCQAPVQPATCLIGATCAALGAIEPASLCAVCDPGTSAVVWTPLAEQAACGTAGGVCHLGACCPRTANCAGRVCGSDGCGGACGACPSTHDCTAGGQCVCTPKCAGKQCGDDGCGGVCGACTYDHAMGLCQSGVCALGPCAEGWIDLNQAPGDGCEEPCTGTLDLPDPPDPAGKDENCDGFDGVLARGIFVSTGGLDSAAGSRAAPVKTIGKAILLAKAKNPPFEVYVAAGTYVETVTLANGVSVHGGYDPATWAHAAASYPTHVLGLTPALGIVSALTATGITAPTRVTGLTLEAGPNGQPTGSSIAVSVTASTAALRFEDVSVAAGSGGAGASGTSGTNGAPGSAGGGGWSGCVYGGGFLGIGCGSCSLPAAGIAGSSPCGNNGGKGGQGGEADSSGWGGYYSAGNLTTGGTGGAVGSTGNKGGDGVAGAVGSSGVGGDGFGRVVGGAWLPSAGTAAGVGAAGAGGGGGGGGGGEFDDVTFECKTYGASGGGGGGGGCPGTSGTAGYGGGGSIGFLLHGSPVVLQRVGVTRGAGGAGGGGGAGGWGGAGGNGGNGGTGNLNGEGEGGGGKGGAGGKGGDGGSAGGGAGGVSIGILWTGGAQPNLDAVTYASTGSGGPGGAGVTGKPSTPGRAGVTADLFHAPSELGTPCDGADADKCTYGVWTLAANLTAVECINETVVGIVETCNGKDDDCDGQTDEDWPDKGKACDGWDSDLCKKGTTTCRADGTGLECVNESASYTEACNGLDDDCSGVVDDWLYWKGTYKTVGDACEGTGECGAGVIECKAGSGVACSTDSDGSASQASYEYCDGLDNDCNGVTDDGYLNTDGDSKADCVDTDDDNDGDPDTTDCKPKDPACYHGKTEVCGDGKDNDCDGSTDEGC